MASGCYIGTRPGLEQLCALEHFAGMGMHSSSVPESSHWPHVTIERLKCDRYGGETNLNLESHDWLVATAQGSVV